MNYSVRSILPVACMTAVMMSFGCSSSSDNDNEAIPDASGLIPLNDAALAELEGIWDQRGYGNVYEYDGSRTTWYAVTENACLEVSTDPGLAGITSDEVAEASYRLQGDQLALALPGEAFALRLERLSALPTRCGDAVARDAQGVFDYLWQTFDEYYAFFELRNVDWAAEYANKLPTVAEATDDNALFGVLADLLSPIDDGHVFLVSDNDDFSPAIERGLNLEIGLAFAAQSEADDVDVWADDLFDQFEQVLVSRLDEGSVTEQGPLIWATANGGSIGYMMILSMEGYVLDADDEAVDVSSAEDLAAASAAMDLAMEDLANTSRMIVDVRLNGGGNDAISFNFAQRFVSERQLAFSKTARSRDYQSVPVEAWLEPPAAGAYLNPVTLIVGADTASAAEIFAIPLSRLPQVEVIGERTAGILSDVLVKPLPNGWFFGLSNEVYLDVQGESFEGIGLTPDIEVPVFQVENIQNGVDPALDRALGM